MNITKVKDFWRRNRTLIVLIMTIYFILSTFVEIALGILFLYWGEIFYVWGLVLFAIAFASGCYAFALVRIRNKTS